MIVYSSPFSLKGKCCGFVLKDLFPFFEYACFWMILEAALRARAHRDNEKEIPDISIGRITERYFEIMEDQGEKTYEKPYYFLSEEHREKVLKIYVKLGTNDSSEGSSKFPNQKHIVRGEGEIHQ